MLTRLELLHTCAAGFDFQEEGLHEFGMAMIDVRGRLKAERGDFESGDFS